MRVHPLNPRPPGRRTGFTLIELLVVVGIIVLLTGLALPMVLRSYRTANITRTRSDLHLLGTALEAYAADFSGAYPQFDDDNTANGLNLMPNRGAVLLCRALLGPAPALTPSLTTNLGDGNDGPGFRVRPGAAGKVYGPYIASEKFKLGGTDTVTFTDATLLDRNGNPILYYPGNPGARASSMVGSFVASVPPPRGATLLPLYNAVDNAGAIPVASLQKLMGAATDGSVSGTPTYTGPYLLWTAGADNAFGLDAHGLTDDVCNFDFPGSIQK